MLFYRRSDGQPFFTMRRESGGVTVYAGIYGLPPEIVIADLDVSAAAKAEAHMLGYERNP